MPPMPCTVLSIFGIELSWFPEGLRLLGKPVQSSIIGISFLGVLPAAGCVGTFQNNPFRWLLVVQKYKERKLKNEKWK